MYTKGGSPLSPRPSTGSRAEAMAMVEISPQQKISELLGGRLVASSEERLASQHTVDDLFEQADKRVHAIMRQICDFDPDA